MGLSGWTLHSAIIAHLVLGNNHLEAIAEPAVLISQRSILCLQLFKAVDHMARVVNVVALWLWTNACHCCKAGFTGPCSWSSLCNWVMQRVPRKF